MKTKEEILARIAELEARMEDSNNYSSGIEYGEDTGEVAALKWVLGLD